LADILQSLPREELITMAKKSKKQNEEELEQDIQDTAEATENEQVEEKEPSLEDKYNELNDKYLRLYSEFDNFRRRTAKERVELFKTAGQDILTDLLPVLDDFERALSNMNEKAEVKSIKEGVDLVYNKFRNTLDQKGLKAFNAIGETFDPDLHEAITKIPAPSKKMKGKVVDEVEKGYKLNDKVLRFAKVVVGE
jgi:molecular chaperone GrpE